MTSSEKQNALLRAKLNLETAQLQWTELQRYFAAGMVITVSEDLDLVEVAVSISNDDKDAVMEWMAQHKLGKVSNAQASAWLQRDASLWTVVVKPWILVQPE